jgi:hypothetical protein
MPDQTIEKTPTLNSPRFAALAIGVVAVVGLAFLIPYVNWTLNKFDWAFRPLPAGAIFILFVLALPVNTLLKRIGPRWAFTGPELLLIYAMMAICGQIANEGLTSYASMVGVYIPYYTAPGNQWAQVILPNVPVWLQVTQPDAIRWYFEGMPAGAAAPQATLVPWQVWITPMAAWGSFYLALYAAFFALGCLLRKDWIEGQRLAFPIVALPIEMAGDPVPSAASSFFRSRLMWAGFALPVIQSLLQMGHAFAPAVPYAPLYFDLGRWWAGNGVWDSIRYTTAYIGFETIGIMALMPTEVSLSLWLFFLLNRAQTVAFAALGFGQEAIGASQFSPEAFIAHQEAGGAIVLALILVWQSRRAIGQALCSLIGRRAPYDPLDPMPPAMALLLLVLSFTFMVIWVRSAGMQLWVFGLFIGIFFAYSLALARLVAAAGVFVPDVTLHPWDLLVSSTGAATYSPRSLTMMTFLQSVFMREYKINPLQYTMDDLKVLHAGRLPGRLAAGALLLALVLMLVFAPFTNLHAIYTEGAQRLDPSLFLNTGEYQFGQLAASLRTPEVRNPYLPAGLLFGGAVMLGLSWLNTNFVGWAISPIGFIMGGTWGLGDRIWTNALIAWVVVSVMIRFGGLPLYRRSRPFFLGMVLGNFAMVGLRSLIDPLLGLHMFLTAW